MPVCLLTEAFTAARRGFDGTGGLADVAELGLTQKQIRTALTTLDDVGFLVRAIPAGNGWQAMGRGAKGADPLSLRVPICFAVPSRQGRKPPPRERPRSSGYAASKINSRPLENPPPCPSPPAPIRRGIRSPRDRGSRRSSQGRGIGNARGGAATASPAVRGGAHHLPARAILAETIGASDRAG